MRDYIRDMHNIHEYKKRKILHYTKNIIRVHLLSIHFFKEKKCDVVVMRCTTSKVIIICVLQETL